MMEEIITLIIQEALAQNKSDTGSALQDILASVNAIINRKVQDLARVDNMELPDEFKGRIRHVILQTR